MFNGPAPHAARLGHVRHASPSDGYTLRPRYMRFRAASHWRCGLAIL